MEASEYDSVDFETRNFIDDMHDDHIRSLAFRQYDSRGEWVTSLVNKHGKCLTRLNNEQVWAIGRYCQFLIESGAVKAALFPTKESITKLSAKHIGIVNQSATIVYDRDIA